MLHHLLLKVIHVPESSAELGRCAEAFWEAYLTIAPGELVPDLDYLLVHVGALMSARVDAKSPADYLDQSEREIARAAGSRLLLDPPDSLDRAIGIVQMRRR
jgi:hypothetical protein